MPSFFLVRRVTSVAASVVLLSLSLSASRSLAYGSSGEEDRCTQLGASCACGEPFNTNRYDALDGTWWNPADTTGTKQCDSTADNGAGLFAGTGYNPNNDVVAEADLVTGGYGDRLPTGTKVKYVLKTQYNPSFPLLEGEPTGAGVQRMCQRTYFMRDKDMVIPAGGGFKDMEICAGNLQFIWGNGTRGNQMMWMSEAVGSACDNGNGATYGNPLCTGVGNLDQSGCIGHWCRVEFCVYGALTGSGNVYSEGYVQRVDNPNLRRDYAPSNYGDLPVDGTGGCLGNKIWSGVQGSNTNPGKLVSHSMQAIWSTDSPGLFIGPAAEIEGGGGSSSTPPPPTVQPPVAPVLKP